MSRPVPAGICVVLIDAIQIKRCSIVGALGVDENGQEHLLGLAEGATENPTLVTGLIEDLVEQSFGVCRREARNLRRRRSGEQALRRTAAGLEQAARGRRWPRGHRSMPVLLAGLKRHIDGIDFSLFGHSA
jgi:hypothetical protein